MKLQIVQNGVIKIVISPETEIERLQIAELFKGPVEVQIMDKLQILDKNIVDAVIISPAGISKPIAI